MEISTVSPAGTSDLNGIASAGRNSLTESNQASGSSPGDAERFSQALATQRSLLTQSPPATASADSSIGNKLVSSLSEMSSSLKNDQDKITRMIEKASSGGDSVALLQAMMAVSDYQQRVQIISKTVSKASSSIDQLTRLQ